MRIGVDATCWHNTRGYGRHIRALLGTLVRGDRRHSYVFITDSAAALETLSSEVEVRRVAASAPTVEAASSSGRRALGDMWRMSRALAAPDLDVLLFPTVYSYVPVLSRAKKVVMIHDVIAEKYPQLTVPRPLARLLWKAKGALGRWQAHALITVSEHSRRGLVEHFRLQPERIFVVGEASDPVFRVLQDREPTSRLADLGLAHGRLLVYVGGFGPHKNLETLVAAFARVVAQDDLSDVRLVLVGEYEREVFHSYYGTIRRHVEALGLSSRVVFTGFLPDEELVVLLNRATALGLPSLLEGFGLPAVEAAACGCPVVATTASPLPELLGRGGLFVDPLDPPGWERALAAVLRSEDLRSRLREEGLAAAQRLTWDAAARQLLAVLERVGT
jgi:glycosyltransferase involved in cell wall biosynthesis